MLWLGSINTTAAFQLMAPAARLSATQLSMVLEKPVKEISKLETLKVASDHLIHPLVEASNTLTALYDC
jgi:hypothetical protein